jgi:hypothetical protein
MPNTSLTDEQIASYRRDGFVSANAPLALHRVGLHAAVG